MRGDIEAQVASFGVFVAEVHNGRTPFPWQSDLVRRILTDRCWPDGIDVQTGLGKTATLDVAVFAAGFCPEVARRRIFLVVDRRIVVDEAHDHARRIADALAEPAGPVSRQIAQALRQPGDDGPILSVTRMRGGTTWDRLWLPRPDRYAIITGTVDQIGSRLLFRGYGVSPSGRPIDAALTGTDSLIILDEAHLAQPFRTTVDAAFAAEHAVLMPPPVVVTMSATPLHGGNVHTITSVDENHAIAGKRLGAAKQLHFVEVTPASKAKAATVISQAISALASQMAEPGKVLGAVVNTVARARAIHENLARNPDIEAILLIGRCRGVDRDRWMAEHYPKVQVGRPPHLGKALVLVATQTAEVGANIDLDSLITESAPLASLTQRLGRLNRLGDRGLCTAVVVHDALVQDDDPIYGPARLATWNYLRQLQAARPYQAAMRFDTGLPASPADLRRIAHDAPPQVLAATPYTPVLLPTILDSWARTLPAPHPDTPIAPYLHGVNTGSAPVTVVWRAGLADIPVEKAAWVDVIDRLPPTADEGIDVPIAALRRWLETGAEDAITDLETTPADAVPESVAVQAFRRYDRNGRPLVLVWLSAGEAEITTSDRIRPGATIIAPIEYGGCDQYGWHPAGTQAALDVADITLRNPLHNAGETTAVLRLGPTLDALATAYNDLLSDPDAFHKAVQQLRQLAQAHFSGEQIDAAAYQDLVEQLRATGPRTTTPLGGALDRLASGRSRAVPWAPNADDLWTPDSLQRPWDVLLAGSGLTLTDDDAAIASSACCGTPLGLDAHQNAVALRAAEFAQNLGLPPLLTDAVAKAGRWHDEGKRDPRFQAMLHGGDPLAAELADELLAKSGMDPADRAAFSRARARSGYPRGMRHEELSERIAARRLADDRGDIELVLHLIAAHHGHGRPLLPPAADSHPVDIGIEDCGTFPSHLPANWNAVDRFITLNQRYGCWGLALLETIVRLADMWASAHNEGATDGPH